MVRRSLTRKVQILILCIVFLLTAVASGATAKDYRHHHSKTKGALIGGGAGYIVGGKKGAVLGAGAGALIQHHRNKKLRRQRGY